MQRRWFTLLPSLIDLAALQNSGFALCLNIFPDGGVSRLRAWGRRE
jgi:hypothetical protein